MRSILILLISSICFYVTGFSQDYESINDEFKADTAVVENNIRQLLNNDDSTVGMVQASAKLEEEYDVLLNKYYQKLYSALDENGKNALKTAQLSWIKFRDNEKKLIRALQNDIYERMGGGTMWGVVATSHAAELTKKRVIEIYNYLVTFYF